MHRILLVEDDASIRETLRRSLTERGHTVNAVSTGTQALREAVDTAPDLMLLDLGLPDLDGAEVLARVRRDSSVPVIVITARDDEPSTVLLLDTGADDYVVKPFSVEHLEARIRAVLRRPRGTADAPVRVGDLTVDLRSRRASLAGRPLELTRREFDLLAYLVVRAGTVVSKRELLAEVWHQPYGGGDRTVDVHLSWLRRKLGEPAGSPRYLHTVRGAGVRLAAP